MFFISSSLLFSTFSPSFSLYQSLSTLFPPAYLAWSSPLTHPCPCWWSCKRRSVSAYCGVEGGDDGSRGQLPIFAPQTCAVCLEGSLISVIFGLIFIILEVEPDGPYAVIKRSESLYLLEPEIINSYYICNLIHCYAIRSNRVE